MSPPLEPPNSAVSHSSTTRFSFRWTVKRFSKRSKTYSRFHSSGFPFATAASQFALVLFPQGINANLGAYLSIGLEYWMNSTGEQQHIPVRYRLWLVNSQTGCRHNTKEWFDIFSYSKRMSMFGQFITKRELYDPSNGLLTDDILVIHCEMTVLGANGQMYLPPEMSKTAEMVSDRPTALDHYINANLDDLSALAQSQPKLMTQMILYLMTESNNNNRLDASSYIDAMSDNCSSDLGSILILDWDSFDTPDWTIHNNQVEETLSHTYKSKICEDGDHEFDSWSPAICPKSMQELKQLSRREMLNLLGFWMVSGTGADLSFVVGDHDEKVLSVHSIVLLNRSPAFDVFLNEIKQKDRMSIGDEMSNEVFDQLIHYLYTGKVPLLKQYQYELLNVSMKYGFNILKQMSALTLFDQVTTENVLSTLTFAHSICAFELKRACLDYATDHATQLVMMNFDDLCSLKPELIEEMFRNLALKSSLLDYGAAEKLINEILVYDYHCEKILKPQLYTDGFFVNQFFGNKVLRNRILRDEAIRRYIFPSIQQRQDCAKFDHFVEETCTLTTRHYGKSTFFHCIHEQDNSRKFNLSGLPDNYRIARIPRVVSRENDRYEWHEFNSSFESSNVKTLMAEPNCSVTVHFGVSVRDSDENLRYSTDKWIHVTRNSGLVKVRGFVSDHILKSYDFNNFTHNRTIPLTIKQWMSVYESVEVKAHTKYVRSLDLVKQMSLERVLLDLRSPFNRKASNEPIPSVTLELVLNLLLGAYLLYNDGQDQDIGEQKRWETDLLVNVVQYGIDYVKSTFDNFNVEQISNENVLKLLYLSGLCDGFNRLRQVCVRFIIEQVTFESIFTDYWKVVAKSRPELVLLMFSLLATSKQHHNFAVASNNPKKQFQMFYENYRFPLKVSNRIEETVSYTHLSLHHIVYDWPIDSIISTLIKPNFKLVSPKFCAPEKSSLKFRITKLESSRDKGKQKMFATNLVLKRDRLVNDFDKKKTDDAIIRYKVSFEYAKETLTSRDYVQRLELGSSYIYLSNDLSLPIDDLLEYYSENMLETNRFNIRCEITLLCGISAHDLTKPSPKLYKLVESSRKRFLKCMNRLLKSDDDYKRDVTLDGRETEFKVHGIFLTQSPVLAALVAQSNRITISDLSIEAFVPFVQYLYTGKVQSLDKYAKQLLIVAIKYKLELLVEICQLELSQSSSKSQLHK